MTSHFVLPPVLAFARIAFLDHLAYRLRYVVGVLNYMIYMGVQYFLWSAVYASAAAETRSLGGLSFHEMMTYFAVGWIVRVSTFNNVDRELSDSVSQGDIARDMLRPVSLLTRYYGHAAGEAAFRLAFMGLPTALLFFPLFGVTLPGDWAGPEKPLILIPTFAISGILSFHVFFLLNFITGLGSVFFEKLKGLLWAKFILVQFLSGLLVPFSLFPGWARSTLQVLPFRAIVHGPATIYLGRGGEEEVWREIALQAFWAAVLYLLSRRLWTGARKKLLVMGG